MSKNNFINVRLFGTEIGRLGYDPDQSASFFQYHPDYLASNTWKRIFPYVFRRITQVQVFKKFSGETFRGLPPMVADSLPDMFGNIIFKEWLEAQHRTLKMITPLEQLAYVANRGMGALEYLPAKDIPSDADINIQDLVEIVQKVLNKKGGTQGERLNTIALFNIFKIGTSAGGARPKVLVAECKKTKKIIPGDMVTSNDYNHYLVKLHIPTASEAYTERVEYAYYQLAIKAGITMMPSRLIEEQHFATLRFDRQHGEKIHTLTASGLTGWDFKDPEHSTYENLFRLAIDLKVPYKDIQEIFRRMVFNVVFANADDHLKNHSFMYNREADTWELAPAYDLNYPFNIELNFTQVSRALAINNKRRGITRSDLLTVADTFSIKDAKGIMDQIVDAAQSWEAVAGDLGISEKVIQAIRAAMVSL